MNKNNILVINPGSTSTQVAYFVNRDCLYKESISHTNKELLLDVEDQLIFRKNVVLEFIKKKNINKNSITAIAARGGRLKPIPSGTYKVDDAMVEASLNKENGNHASRLAVIIGNIIADEIKCEVYSVDPISVDEMIPKARISGMPEIERKSLGHALNMKAVARKAALELNKEYKEVNLVVAHLGGGTTISVHKQGEMIDIINDFEGTFTPERSGGLPILQLVKLCYSGDYNEEELIRKIEGEGGFYAYLNTKDFKEIELKMKNKDEKATLLMEAYYYQLKKSIGAMLTTLDYDVDSIVLTGSIANSNRVVKEINNTFQSITEIKVFPGSFELEALALGVYRVKENIEQPKFYIQECGK